MTAKEVSTLSGVSVRTLHHYDRIGLLTPVRNGENGYRVYTQTEVDRLHQILLFRACGMKLEQIAKVLHSADYHPLAALELQRKALLRQREGLDGLLDNVNQTIQSLKGDTMMSNKDKFKGFDFSENPYEAEARQRWGDQGVDESNAYVKNLGAEGQAALGEEMNQQFRALATLRHLPPESAEVQTAVGAYCDFLSRFASYTPEGIAGLGQMYVDDERFAKNIDAFGEGLSAFLAKAMTIYAQGLAK